jgi:hypothetical protein
VAEGGLLDGPVDLEIDRDGTVFVGNLWAGDVVHVDLVTGTQTKVDTPYIVTALALAPYPECSDGRDDDGDGLVDWPADPGCRDATASTESPICQDGIDNDGHPGIDFDGGAAANGGVPLAAPDPQCRTPWAREGAGCGLGAEMTLILVAAERLANRSRRRAIPRDRADR